MSVTQLTTPQWGCSQDSCSHLFHKGNGEGSKREKVSHIQKQYFLSQAYISLFLKKICVFVCEGYRKRWLWYYPEHEPGVGESSKNGMQY